MNLLSVLFAFFLLVNYASAGEWSHKIKIKSSVRNQVRDFGESGDLVFLMADKKETKRIIKSCRLDAQNCECNLYPSIFDPSFVRSTHLYINAKLNYLGCQVPEGMNSLAFNYVELKQVNGKKKSGLIPISSWLSLEEVLGKNVDKSKLRTLWAYQCQNFFFQGAGVEPMGIDCGREDFVLNIIRASYDYYLYDNSFDSNDQIRNGLLSKRIARQGYGVQSVCGIPDPTRFECETSNDRALLGMRSMPSDLFNTELYLTAAPDEASMSMGWVVGLDAEGNCPPGFEKFGSYMAKPTSETVPPSHYINTSGTLNSFLIANVPYSTSQELPAHFNVIRDRGEQPCVQGICGLPTGASEILQSVAYERPKTYFCALPSSLVR